MRNKEELVKIKSEILPLSKKWNQNRLFLVWGFLAALFGTTGLELFRIIGRDYSFKWGIILSSLINFNNQDYYLIGVLIFLIFFFIVLIKISKVIDERANNLNQISRDLDKSIKSLG